MNVVDRITFLRVAKRSNKNVRKQLKKLLAQSTAGAFNTLTYSISNIPAPNFRLVYRMLLANFSVIPRVHTDIIKDEENGIIDISISFLDQTFYTQKLEKRVDRTVSDLVIENGGKLERLE